MNTKVVESRLKVSSQVSDIYKKLTSKRARSGSLPPKYEQPLITNKIQVALLMNRPIPLFTAWGAMKNLNLPILEADACEEATLRSLYNLHSAIRQIYSPGLSFTLKVGDAKMSFVHNVPISATHTYCNSFERMAKRPEFEGIFNIVRVSDLYDSEPSFYERLEALRQQVEQNIDALPILDKLSKNAQSNSQKNTLDEEGVKGAVIRYVTAVIADQKFHVFRNFYDNIVATIGKRNDKFRVVYRTFLEESSPFFVGGEGTIYLYSGEKGNITQPWQAKSLVKDGRTIFLSQTRLGQE